jgi:phosphoribosyl 1,2-cyclic phosphodiesterase
MLDVTFYGVRGSTPCSGHDSARYGGNTSCVVLEVPGRDPIIFDMGTGLRYFGESILDPTGYGEPFRGTALVTHLHWDHVQGLPFFRPANRPGADLRVVAPAHDGQSVREAFDTFLRRPYFPIGIDDLAGDVSFDSVNHGELLIGDALVTVRPVPHVGETNGYRVDWQGFSVVYISDHQEPVGRPEHVVDEVLELCEGADLLIHDAQYTPVEFAERSHWGHCTIDYALEVARQSKVQCLALFHHDPAHHDEWMDELSAQAAERARAVGVRSLITAYEGLTVSLGAPIDLRAGATMHASGARR